MRIAVGAYLAVEVSTCGLWVPTASSDHRT